MAEPRERRNSNSQLLQDLDALSQTLYQSHATRRTASLALPRSAAPAVNAILADHLVPVSDVPAADHRPRSRRMSMPLFRTRPKSHRELADDDDDDHHGSSLSGSKSQVPVEAASAGEKKGIWGWKPIRALAHITMQRISCLFSVEVVAIQGLPPSMNGLRLCVAVRKKETKEGAMKTMPDRVQQGAADFQETLFVRCHVYCSGKPPKFEPRPFLISAVAVDAPELDFGRNTVDLSLMVKESMERNLEGARIRQWDAAFPLAGKAKGGELVVKLGFQIMEDSGVEIYKQAAGAKSSKNKGTDSSSSMARRQSKSSFSVSSPKITRLEPSMLPSKEMTSMDLRGIDDFNLDEPGPAPPPPPPPPSASPSVQKLELEKKQDDLDLPEFEVIDKGVEVQEESKEQEEAAESEPATDEASVSSEVVKEVVHDSAHSTRLTELDAIAKQIKALESMVAGDESTDPSVKTEQEDENQRLDAVEETVTREFLQMLELEDGKELGFDMPYLSTPAKPAEEGTGGEARCFLSDLAKGLGSVVQTRDGGYLTATNPFDTEVSRRDAPKLAMQISKPIVLEDQKLGSGSEVFQKLAAVGSEELGSKLASLTAMDELTGKTAEQIAFEGIASAIISGRNKEGASSSAAKSVAALKAMSCAMSDGRKERISTGIWNVKDEPVAVEGILPLSLQKIEAMAVEALKIQAEVTDEEPPFDVSPLPVNANPLDSTISPEDWAKSESCGKAPTVTMLAVIQLRDPLRRYETVGAPMMALVQAVRAKEGGGDEEVRFRVASLHVGGMKMGSGGRSGWDGERQRLTAMQWLVAYGLGKAGKKSRSVKAKGRLDSVWSISSRVMADMWLKPTRNPDVKFPEKL